MKHKLIFALALMLCIALFCGCGSGEYLGNSKAEADYGYVVNDGLSADGFYESPESGATDTGTGVLDARKLIKTVHLSIQTKFFEDFTQTVVTSVNAFNGYIEKSDISSYKTYDRRADYTIRIPAQRLDEFTSHISENGVVVSITSSQDDVTLTYVDMEARVTALKTQEESLLRLLAQAETVTDIMEIESRLSDVRYEIESYESQLRTYDNLIDYATVYLSISEVEREEPVSEPETVWDRISNNLEDAVYYIGEFFQNLFVFVVSALPYLAVITVIVLPILYFTVFRPARKRKKARKNKENNTPS